MKKQKIIFCSLLIIIGFSLILYPIISSSISRHKQQKVIDNYTETINIIGDKKYKELIKEAEEYNKKIYTIQKGDKIKDLDSYNEILKVNNNNIMAYINIPKIGAKLPIYHGTSKESLQVGVGHLMSTSIPIGGKNTRSVLFGHRGLPNSELFTNINKLKPGDIFIINFLNEKLYYKVDNTKIIKPAELTKEVKIEKGKDIVTLVTCTPYGINSHRLLINGERVEKPTKEMIYQENNPKKNNRGFIVSIIITIIIIIILLLLKIIKRRAKIERRKKHEKDNVLFIKSIIVFIIPIIFF